ncbi:hypothetical protein ILT44_24445 [Microvirga sp. BT689]|uniref:hypothetical protein n=1 Tax=Microvirga arvi TaxID=2778731 RepID=UPI00194F77E4|nr:hypothetical protein [Microvirga arvi]MBM6583357.1 hypothetical protein [Microvirga arvi]
MSSSPQRLSGPTFFWDANGQPTTRSSHRVEQLYTICRLYRARVAGWCMVGRSTWIRLTGALDQTFLALALRVFSRIPAWWDVARAVLLSKRQALLPFPPLARVEQTDEKPDPPWKLLEDFQGLAIAQQDKVARNLAVLWGHFEEAFGGLSGYLRSPETEQLLYLEKLKAASDRMRQARGTDGAFHYVTVELLRQYVGCFQEGRSDDAAITLAAWVSGLIDRGRRLTAETSAPFTSGQARD